MNILENKKLLRGLLKQADGMNTIGGGASVPVLKSMQSGNNLVLMLHIAGVSPEAYQVFVKDNELFMMVHNSYINESATWQNGDSVPRFVHKTVIPDFVDAENIEAFYEEGVLRVILPAKKMLPNKIRQIHVKQI